MKTDHKKKNKLKKPALGKLAFNAGRKKINQVFSHPDGEKQQEVKITKWLKVLRRIMKKGKE